MLHVLIPQGGESRRTQPCNGVVMKCLVCGVELRKIRGKFGEFFSCKEHGTISIQGGQVVTKGAMTKALRKIAVITRGSDEFKPYQKFDLELEVRKQAVALGGWIDDLDMFIEGSPEASNSEEEEPDHWMNVRPY